MSAVYDPESNPDNYFDEDEEYKEYDETREQEFENERLSSCICGAYQWSQKQGRFVAVADCICGNT